MSAAGETFFGINKPSIALPAAKYVNLFGSN
jgi:hypothetical protein